MQREHLAEKRRHWQPSQKHRRRIQDRRLRIRQVRRTHIRADGRQRQAPEARAALCDLESVRDHITGSREALIEARFYAVIYADAARTREELKQSLHNLDRYCEQMVTAMKAFRSGARPGTVMDRIAKGFSDEEIKAIADWYARSKAK